MNGKILTREFAIKVYDILVNLGGASESMREAFIHAHSLDAYDEIPCWEWRFEGKLGFGGKYWSKRNKVDCYQEDENPERLKLIEQINAELAKIPEMSQSPFDPKVLMALGMQWKVLYESGQSCQHPGCAHHYTHPCEGCGRIAAVGVVISFIPLPPAQHINNPPAIGTK